MHFIKIGKKSSIPWNPLASVGSDSDFIMNFLVDEVDIVKTNVVSKKPLVTLVAYGDKVFCRRKI